MLRRLISSQLARLLITVLTIGGCLFCIWITSRAAIAQLLVRSASAFRSVPAATAAAQVNRRDPEAHFARAALLRASGALAESLGEFEQAIRLRPRDYYLWLELAMTREESGDTAGALAAFNEAVKLAPFYAQPRWQRGNLLLRLRRYEEAFQDLRIAADSDPELVPSLLDLSWGLSQENTALAQHLAGATSPRLQIAFALYLARRGKAQQALGLFKASGLASEDDRRELVRSMIATGAYSEAFQTWAAEHDDLSKGEVYDGGFEHTLTLEESSFGWRIPRTLTAVQLSQNPDSPHTGNRSLQIDFSGESNTGSVLLSQLIAVEPNQSYDVNFAVKSRDLVTGGLPLFKVVDATEPGVLLGSSEVFRTHSDNWSLLQFAFATRSTTTAVVLSLERQSCTTSPCPAFGTLWLDSFTIKLRK